MPCFSVVPAVGAEVVPSIVVGDFPPFFLFSLLSLPETHLLGFHALNISDEIEDFVETHIYKMLIIILKYGVFLGRT